MNIGVYGSGYLATVVSACIADFGVPVTCIDENVEAIGAMARGNVPYFEKNLQDMVRRGIRSGRLVYSSDLLSLSRKVQVIFIALDSANGLDDVIVRLSRLTVDEKTVVINTPVSVGTASRIEKRLGETGKHITVVSHPVFLTDGCAVEDFNWPDRILLGTDSSNAVQMLKKLYHPLVMRGVPVIVTSHETAELVREASTAFVATKLAFINELARLCEHVDADANDLSLALGLDKKIAPRCLQPGAALGGEFAEDELDSLAQLARDKGVGLQILNAAREVNATLCSSIVEKIQSAVQSISGKHVALLGLAFKPNTNSIACSSSITLAKSLVAQGAKVFAYDPVAMSAAKGELDGSVHYSECPYSASEGADVVVLSTAWPEFRVLDYARIKRSLRQPVIVDTKNMLDAARMHNLGFEYFAIGKKAPQRVHAAAAAVAVGGLRPVLVQ